MKAEHKAVILLSRVEPSEAAAAEAKAILSRPYDGYLLAEYARGEGVSSLVYHNLCRLRLQHGAGARLQAAMREEYYAILASNVRGQEQAKELLSAFGRGGVPAVWLKGICLAETVYGNIALRPFSDIDLMIRESDLRRTTEILTALGYSLLRTGREDDPLSYARAFMKPGMRPLDIHWSTLSSTWLRSCVGEKQGLEGVWSRCQPFSLAGSPALSLGPSDQIIHLCQHGFSHSFSRLTQLVDIIESLRFYGDRLDLQAALRQAGEMGMANILYYSIKYAESSLLCPVTHSPRFSATAATRRMVFGVMGLRDMYLPCLAYALSVPSPISAVRALGKIASLALSHPLRKRKFSPCH